MDDTTPRVHHNTYAHDFGILIPRKTGVEYTHQAGGMAPTQRTLEGAFLPLKHPLLFQDEPSWVPDGPHDEDGPHPLHTLDFDEVPERDYEMFPSWVKERGHFLDWDEYHHWKRQSEVWWYGALDLIAEVRRWNYDPDGNLLDRDMSEAWDGLDDIWTTIDERLRFTYETYDYYDAELAASREGVDADHPLPDDYPSPGEAIRWITVTGSKEDNRGRTQAPWAEDLAGETVVMLYPNCD